MRGVDQQIIVGVGADADFLPVEFLQIHHQLIPHLKETNQTKTKQKKPQQNGVLMANGMNLATHRVEGSFLEPLHGGCSDGRLKLAQENRIVSSSFFFYFSFLCFCDPDVPATLPSLMRIAPIIHVLPVLHLGLFVPGTGDRPPIIAIIHRSIDPSIHLYEYESIFLYIVCMM